MLSWHQIISINDDRSGTRGADNAQSRACQNGEAAKEIGVINHEPFVPIDQAGVNATLPVSHAALVFVPNSRPAVPAVPHVQRIAAHLDGIRRGKVRRRRPLGIESGTTAFGAIKPGAVR